MLHVIFKFVLNVPLIKAEIWACLHFRFLNCKFYLILHIMGVLNTEIMIMINL